MDKDIDIIKESWKNFEQKLAETIYNLGKIIYSNFDKINNIKTYIIEVYDHNFGDRRDNFKIKKISISFKIFADSGKIKVESFKILNNENFTLFSTQGRLYNLVYKYKDKLFSSNSRVRKFEFEDSIAISFVNKYGYCTIVVTPLGTGLKFDQNEGDFIISNTQYDFGVLFYLQIIKDSFEKVLLKNLDEELDFTDSNKVNTYLTKLNNEIFNGCLLSFPKKVNEVLKDILLETIKEIQNIIKNPL